MNEPLSKRLKNLAEFLVKALVTKPDDVLLPREKMNGLYSWSLR